MKKPMHRVTVRLASAAYALGLAFVLLAVSERAFAVEPPRAVHGSADLYAAQGVTLAWGVLRGATEASTLVVVRIVVAPGAFGAVSVIGIDPFTHRQQTLLPPTPTTAVIDVRIPRAQFADFPRTEFHLYASVPKAATDGPSLGVYYVGIPDTTPEFASEAALESYVAKRVAGAREGTGSKTP